MSALDGLASAVMDILNLSTGTPLTFMCTGCHQAFLFPTRAAEDYLASLAGCVSTNQIMGAPRPPTPRSRWTCVPGQTVGWRAQTSPFVPT